MKMTADDVMSRRRVLAGSALGGLTIGAGLVGCSSSQNADAQGDSSWVKAEVGRVSVRHPAEWVEKPSEEDNVFTKVFGSGNRLMSIAGDYSHNTDPVLVYADLDGTATGMLEDYHSKGWDAITVKGAGKAAKCPFVFKDEDKTVYGWWLVASLPAPIGGTSVVSIYLPTEDPDFVDKVIPTMELHDQ